MTQCEHIHGNGARCLSPVLHRRSFCYMHWRQREHKLAVPPEPEFHLPIIDSEASVVLASNQIASAVLAGKLDPKRARIVLACMKMALDSLRRLEDASEVTECELTPAMHKELLGTAHDAKDDPATSPTNQPDLSSPGGPQSDEGFAVVAPSRPLTTPAMHKEVLGTAHDAKDDPVTPATSQPALSSRGGRQSDEGSAVAACSPPLTAFQQSARNLLDDLTSSAPATIEDLERILDRHPSFTGVTS